MSNPMVTAIEQHKLDTMIVVAWRQWNQGQLQFDALAYFLLGIRKTTTVLSGDLRVYEELNVLIGIVTRTGRGA